MHRQVVHISQHQRNPLVRLQRAQRPQCRPVVDRAPIRLLHITFRQRRIALESQPFAAPPSNLVEIAAAQHDDQPPRSQLGRRRRLHLSRQRQTRLLHQIVGQRAIPAGQPHRVSIQIRDRAAHHRGNCIRIEHRWHPDAIPVHTNTIAAQTPMLSLNTRILSRDGGPPCLASPPSGRSRHADSQSAVLASSPDLCR